MHTLKLSMALLLRRISSCVCFVQEAVQNLVLVTAPQPSPQLVLDLRDWRVAVVVPQFLQSLVVGHGLRGRFMRHCAPSARHSPPAAEAAPWLLEVPRRNPAAIRSVRAAKGVNVQDTSAEPTPDLQLEIAHLLLIDVVGYSKLLVN
jgi:hypothetical protein